MTVTCTICGTPAEATKYRTDQLKRTGRTYCGQACSKEYRRKISSETMARTNRKYASARMISNNPVHREGVREKISATHKALGVKPKVQGGNGKPLPEAEQMLITLFADVGFTGQCVVPTRMGRASGYPTCYKLDCGNVALKLGLEADGVSHTMASRKLQDRKKDEFLAGLGWTVLRFSNAEIMSNPAAVVTTVMSTISKLKACIPTSPTG